MAVIVAKWADNNVRVFGDRIAQLNTRFPKVLPRIVNQVGERAKTQVVRALTKQTGLPRKTIVKAVGNPARAHGGKLSYDMATRGGFIRLKYLAPRETRKGVIARPFGKSQLFAGTFLKGGGFPNRRIVKVFDGHVYRRLNVSGTQIGQVKSEVRIPTEMTRGPTARAFLATAQPLLKQRVEAALTKLVP
jgi:hypothetical protein